MTATLQMLLDEKIGLYAWCGRCQHSATLKAAKLVKRFGRDCPIPTVAHNIRCTKCGHSPLEVQPDWPSKGPGNIVNPIP